jgi:adenine-specific DNA-methyltransferase
MSFLQKAYSRNDFLHFIKNDFLPDFNADNRPVRTHDKSLLKNVEKLGDSAQTSISIFEAICDDSDHKKRVAITQDAFRVLKDTATRNALVVFYSENSNNWRLSLLTSTFDLDSKGRVISKVSNPRRFSYFLGKDAKTVTPHKYLVAKGRTTNLADLQKRFAVEVVNNDFYREITKLYDELVGAEKGATSLRYPGEGEAVHQFAVRLIGRIIFCWFLREKRSEDGTPLIPEDVLSRKAAQSDNYYHSVLAPLFFEVLNKRTNSREVTYRKKLYASIPYLNGGLFSPDTEDHYKYDKSLELSIPGIIDVPDQWIRRFFDLLELYNFTVDENTSYDIDLSIDPEMLGRVFENLLARINPETGETVRKSTGSFYTPREIVDYMVDTSLVQYLSTSTDVGRLKLEALVSYDLLDDRDNELNEKESESVLEALSTLTVLDPACGSGAFPIGMLQKIVFIISNLDPDAKRWLAKQLKDATPEIRREFENKGVDYIRKLGVIRQTIYGVDIQPIATEISRLRCFLTLVVDEKIDDSQENRGIKPLPNLEFKFVTANSLIKPPSENSAINTSLFEDFGSKLSDKVKEYFSAHGEEKVGLLLEIRDIIDEKADKNTSYVLNNYGLFKDDRFTDAYNQKNTSVNTKLLEEADIWKSYRNIFNHKPVKFFDIKYFFPSVAEGFDIVIANPPYIRADNPLIAHTREQIMKSKNYVTLWEKWDIYIAFLERSHQLLKNKGILEFIIPDSFTKSKYAIKSQQYFIENTTISRIDFCSNIKIFEASVKNIIIQIQNHKNPDHKPMRINHTDTFGNSDILPTEKQSLTSINIFHPSIDDKPLGNHKNTLNWGSICYVSKGIVPQSDEKKYKGEFKKNDLISSYKDRTHPKPYTEGKWIKRFVIEKTMFLEWETKRVPSRISRPTFVELYKAPKIIRAILGDAVFDKTGVLCNDSCILSVRWNELKEVYNRSISNSLQKDLNISGVQAQRKQRNELEKLSINFDYRYLLAILNSKYGRYYLNFVKKSALGRLYPDDLKSLPIKKITTTEQQKFNKLVDTVVRHKSDNPLACTEELEEELDNLIYDLYEITPEEIKLIEESIK